MPLFVQTITFNIDANPASSALNMRENYANAIVTPEYSRGVRSEPALYARDPVVAAGNAVRLDVTFTGGPAGATVPIRAVAAPGTILGAIPATPVTFDGAGNAAIQFALNPGWTAGTGVTRQQVTWTWEYDPGGGFQNFDTTQHIIFVVLAVPSAPWTQAAGSNQLPWASALQWACVFANGTTTTLAATTAMANGINGSGARYQTLTVFGTVNYNLTGFLAAIGTAFAMNCTDCANAVTTLSNLLGATTIEGRFNNMTTNAILGIGGVAGTAADWRIWNWAYHEICWLAFNPTSVIWDAAARLANPAPPANILPANMPFTTIPPSPADYLPRLISAGPATLAAAGTRRPVV